MNFNIQNISEEKLENNYDIGFFSCGYERRCINFPSLYGSEIKFNHKIVLSFSNLSNVPSRINNDHFYREEWGKSYFEYPIDSDDDTCIYDFLNEVTSDQKERLTILVDYTSMSRIWYSAIINWSRYAVEFFDIQIDFVYSVGVYKKRPFTPFMVKQALSLPGFEGKTKYGGDCIAFIGLGFHGFMAQYVFEALEPEEVYPFISIPGPYDNYERTICANNDFVLSHSHNLIKIPYDDITTSFYELSKMIQPYINSEVIIIPMGPKTQILSSILLALKYDNINCLRVSADRDEIEDIEAKDGNIVLARVFMSKDL